MGRQLNASVIYVINEVELSIYRFLTSGAKKNKSSLNQSNWGLTGSLAIGVFNALIGYRCFNQTSIGKKDTSIKKGRLLDKRECFKHSLTRPRPWKGNQSTCTLAD